MFVDSDDYILQDSCEKLIMQVEDKCDIVVGEAKIIYPNKIKYQKHKHLKENEKYTSKEYIIKSINHNEFYAPVCTNLYKRSFLMDNDLFYKKGIYHEDMEILLKTFLKARIIKCLKYPFYQYVIRDNSITTKKTGNEKNVNDLFSIYTNWLEIIETIEDKKLQKKLKANLSKHVIHTCRYYKVEKSLPIGIDYGFLLKNTLNIKELLKTIFFIICRKWYIKM